MDSEVNLHKSLPPLVEGKVHGYLKFTIDEIIWSKKSPGEVTVLASWWGELDSAQFRPTDIISGDSRTDQETSQTYAIKTNITLFKEYIKNCETIELIFINEKSHEVIGTSQVAQLLDIFEHKLYVRYLPIYNANGIRLGEVHVVLKLQHFTKPSIMQLKSANHQKNEIVDKGAPVNNNYKPHYKEKFIERAEKLIESETKDIYKSILKSKRADAQNPVKKFNMEVTDKLVAQVVARAQRLRGAILKETCNEDSLALSDTSVNECLSASNAAENEAKLYEYMLGKEMSSSDERRALHTLRSISPTPSLIDIAAEGIGGSRCINSQCVPSQESVTKINNTPDECSPKEYAYSKSKELSPLDHVDSIRIYIESLSLTPAGFRRAKSSSVLRNDTIPVSVTYFVQYDATFGNTKQANKKFSRDKLVRMCSKKQEGQVIFFNHEGIYGVSNFNVNVDVPLQFKIFIRHLNQKTPTELGIGCMYISDIARTECLSSAQRLAIVSKGIKIGELKVVAELGCDFVHFGKQYVDDIMSVKENIPVMEEGILNTGTDKCRSVTGTQSKTSRKMSSVSAKRIECLTNSNNADVIGTTNKIGNGDQNLDDKKVDVKNADDNNKKKILLHGLIHVAEGKDLPELNTYLICRAFWKEDKATSQICTNTKNPLYHFCQLVPLIHGTDLLERIKDNYVIIEVHSKSNTGVDSLLGIVKLPVHQLYIAFRDPIVLPYLMQSKYPVISVDGWVRIVNPVTGQSSGQILALVALGTAEQIAVLEMSRGIRNIGTVPQMTCNYSHECNKHTNYVQSVQQTEARDNTEVQRCESDQHSTDNHVVRCVYATSEGNSSPVHFKSQEIQTDICTLKEAVLSGTPDVTRKEDPPQSDEMVLNALVDRLARVLNVPKSNSNQSAQTETNTIGKVQTLSQDQFCLNSMNNNCTSDDSRSGSPRDNFHFPTDTYRSVGVGAEFDEEMDQGPTTVYTNSFDFPITAPNEDREETDSASEEFYFRAVVEIECALHLPKVEQSNEFVEPSTYVTFQKNKRDCKTELQSYTITNTYLRSCNPKWEWRTDAKFPIELLVNDEKRLILKIWRLADPDTTTQIDLEKDIVIGFSAIDLSVLTAGFPSVSGWFHIMDFAGKCNGQIKVTITPIDNLSAFGKTVPTTNIPRTQMSSVSQSHWPPVYSPHVSDVETNNAYNTTLQHNTEKHVTNERPTNSGFMDARTLDDTSMSFLSHSLKQKLTELDEITRRLQSRLRDVTNTAFDDEFEVDFDLNEPNSDNENNDNKNSDVLSPVINEPSINETWRESIGNHRFVHKQNTVDSGNQTSSSIHDICNLLVEPASSDYRVINYETRDAGYSTSSNVPSNRNVSNSDYQMQYPDRYSMRNDNSSFNSMDYPVRGTKTHINHLLDKLSLQLPTTSFSCDYAPVKKNVFDLLSNVQQNNNLHNINKTNGESSIVHPRTSDEPVARNGVSFRTHSKDSKSENKSMSETGHKTESCDRISSVIRAELIAEENNDTECDELTTYLITSNVRHMDLDNVFNPLLYQHMVPDMQLSNTVSPEEEAVKRLDSRYVKSFNATLNRGLTRVDNLTNARNMPTTRINLQSGKLRNALESPDNMEHFRLTPAGVSEDVDGKIDLRVSHKSSNNDLMASNSTESTTTISLEKSSERQTEVELDRESYSSSSETSVSGVSRQAPDGGNPVEEIAQPSIANQREDSQDSSSSS